MKKILTLFWILLGAGTLYGQQTVDYILKARAFIEAGKPEQAVSLLKCGNWGK